MNTSEYRPHETERIVTIAYDPMRTRVLWIAISAITVFLHQYYEKISARLKRAEIEKLLMMADWIELHRDKKTGRRVLAESEAIEHQHELITARLLAQVNYDVVFAPKGLFTRSDKKFDVFQIREHILLRADLKNITSKNPLTIAMRIKDGCEQAPRVVINICSDIDHRDLIDGLRGGVINNALIKEVLLFYKHQFFRLSKDLILSKRIYRLLQ